MRTSRVFAQTVTYCSDDKVTQLRAVHDKISVNVRWLEAIREMADQYGSFLIPVITGKLLVDVRLQIAKITTRAVWDVKEILQIVKWEINARKISEVVKIYKHKNTDSNKKNLTPMATGLLVRDGHSSNTNKCCVYCKADCFSARCDG